MLLRYASQLFLLSLTNSFKQSNRFTKVKIEYIGGLFAERSQIEVQKSEKER